MKRLFVRLSGVAVLALFVALEGCTQAGSGSASANHPAALATPARSAAAAGSDLRLIQTIPLPQVAGRIDHLALDHANRRLFIAAIGNDSVEVVDLDRARDIRSLKAGGEPQGVAWVPAITPPPPPLAVLPQASGQPPAVSPPSPPPLPARVLVASGEDGMCRLLDQNLQLVGTVALGADADNVRIAPNGRDVFVGFGVGPDAAGLARIDPVAGTQSIAAKLPSHPEAFAIEPDGSRIFVNLPESGEVAVLRRTGTGYRTEARWLLSEAAANYPLALDAVHHRLFVGCRAPGKLVVFDTRDGSCLGAADIDGMVDDLFYDAANDRVIALCGDAGNDAGAIDIVRCKQSGAAIQVARTGRIQTPVGAQTGLLDPAADRLYLAARAHGDVPAQVRIYALGASVDSNQ
ncbi:MAG: YncE family protein [Planctomycetota bacterium]